MESEKPLRAITTGLKFGNFSTHFSSSKGSSFRASLF